MSPYYLIVFAVLTVVSFPGLCLNPSSRKALLDGTKPLFRFLARSHSPLHAWSATTAGMMTSSETDTGVSRIPYWHISG